MADERESFPTLEDGSGVGTPLTKSEEGDAASGKVGSVGFAFKDASGNLILPALDASGKLPVVFTSGTPKRARGTTAGNTSTPQTIATLTLTTSKAYSSIECSVACRRGGLFQLIWNDNGTPEVLADVLLDSGQYVFSTDFDNLRITSGSTGTQQLLLKGQNFDKASDMYGTICALEAI